MLFSNGSEETHYNTSSWSSSNAASPSPFSQGTPRRTMEEVWKDINLASLSDSNNNNNPNFRNMTLQDFLARPFGNVVSPGPDHHHHHHHHITLNSPPPPPPPQAVMQSPATVLSLNHLDSDQFQLFCIENLNTRPIININHPNSTTLSDQSLGGAYPFEGLGDESCPSSGLVMPSGFGVGKKRLPESDHSNFGGGGGDRRHKRMIKNRESAARSRARKQAYTNELELEVDQLMKENARLRRQQEQLSSAAAASQLPKKHSLQRSSTAPF